MALNLLPKSDLWEHEAEEILLPLGGGVVRAWQEDCSDLSTCELDGFHHRLVKYRIHLAPPETNLLGPRSRVLVAYDDNLCVDGL